MRHKTTCNICQLYLAIKTIVPSFIRNVKNRTGNVIMLKVQTIVYLPDFKIVDTILMLVLFL